MITEEKCLRTIFMFDSTGKHDTGRHPVGCRDNCVCMGSKNTCACSRCEREKAIIVRDEKFQRELQEFGSAIQKMDGVQFKAFDHVPEQVVILSAYCPSKDVEMGMRRGDQHLVIPYSAMYDKPNPFFSAIAPWVKIQVIANKEILKAIEEHFDETYISHE